MNPVSSNPKIAEQTATRPSTSAKSSTPFNLVGEAELVWWPYRSLCRTLLHTHHNTRALVEVNRKLADEMREITRRQQDYMLEMSEKFLARASGDKANAKSPSQSGTESFDELYDSAIAALREFGTSLADAQIRSVNALRDQMHKMSGSANSGEHHREAAE